MDRRGINKSSRGPLAKCSFEETVSVGYWIRQVNHTLDHEPQRARVGLHDRHSHPDDVSGIDAGDVDRLQRFR